MVEAFGLADNLMLEGPTRRRQTTIVRVPESGSGAAAAAAAPEQAVQLAAAELVT